MNFNRTNDQFRLNEVINPYALTGIDFEKLMKDKPNDENYYFLILTIYFYLKNNNYNTTAELLFNESNLGNIFQLPEGVTESGKEVEDLKIKFINYFYNNTYFQQQLMNPQSPDFLSDFWNQFWDIFVEKIRQSNQSNPILDMYLSSNNLKLTCKYVLI
jgi:hypothetical protein